MNYVILVAGGKGLRMGGDVPKQFLPIGGQPVLMHTMAAFCNALPGLHVILVLPADQQAHWRALCKEHHFALPHQVATGGEQRFHSVQNGLALVPDDADGVVGVHDGVRPFVVPEVIRRCYQVAAEQGAAVPVVPVVETVRQIEPPTSSGTPSHTIDRSLLRLVQTPQAFRISLLKQAYRQPYLPSFTDDASVVEALGHPVTLVDGNRENIKLTTPADIRYAEYLSLTTD